MTRPEIAPVGLPWAAAIDVTAKIRVGRITQVRRRKILREDCIEASSWRWGSWETARRGQNYSAHWSRKKPIVSDVRPTVGTRRLIRGTRSGAVQLTVRFGR